MQEVHPVCSSWWWLCLDASPLACASLDYYWQNNAVYFREITVFFSLFWDKGNLFFLWIKFKRRVAVISLDFPAAVNAAIFDAADDTSAVTAPVSVAVLVLLLQPLFQLLLLIACASSVLFAAVLNCCCHWQQSLGGSQRKTKQYFTVSSGRTLMRGGNVWMIIENYGSLWYNVKGEGVC